MLLPNRMEVMGKSGNELVGPNRLTKAILNHPHGIDYLEVDVVDQITAPSVLVYNGTGKLEDALEYSSDTQTPLIMLTTDPVDSDPAFPLVTATRHELVSFRYASAETHAETVFDIYRALGDIPDGMHRIADLVSEGIVKFGRMQPSEVIMPPNIRVRKPRDLSIKNPRNS